MSRALAARRLLPGLVLAAVVGLSLWQVVSAHRRLSHTVDEPVHIVAGLEWLQRGDQYLHPENPPLGRIGAGLDAYLGGQPVPPRGRPALRGIELLYGRGAYLDRLAGARRGTLPFYLLLLAVVGWWATRSGGATAAAVAVGAVASLPAIVAHATLATTDIPFAAVLLLAIWRLARWFEEPPAKPAVRSWRWASAGLAAGLAVATKFSGLLFLPAAAGAMALVRWTARRSEPRARRLGEPRRGLEVLGMIVLAGVVVWGSYGFEIGRLADAVPTEPLVARAFPDPASTGRLLAERLVETSLPAPGALNGLLFLLAHARVGHPAYLLGEFSQHGFWYFYPVALAFKTPLAFLLLAGIGLGAGWRWRGDWRHHAPVAAAGGILLASLTSSINIGIRHVLVLYPLLAVGVATGIAVLLRRLDGVRRRFALSLVAALLAALVWASLAAHPNQLAFFNRFAGDEPGRILVDSDLDWGQGLLQLAEVLEERSVEHLQVAFFGSASLCAHGLPPVDWLPPGRPVSGWVAVSEMYYRGHWRWTYRAVCPRRGARHFDRRDGYAWLDAYRPVTIAGGSIRLYRVP